MSIDEVPIITVGSGDISPVPVVAQTDDVVEGSFTGEFFLMMIN